MLATHLPSLPSLSLSFYIKKDRGSVCFREIIWGGERENKSTMLTSTFLRKACLFLAMVDMHTMPLHCVLFHHTSFRFPTFCRFGLRYHVFAIPTIVFAQISRFSTVSQVTEPSTTKPSVAAPRRPPTVRRYACLDTQWPPLYWVHPRHQLRTSTSLTPTAYVLHWCPWPQWPTHWQSSHLQLSRL